MNGHDLLQGVTAFLNSPVGFAVVWAALIALFGWLASRWNPFEKEWEKYEGSIITAIKLAEKNLPDNTPNPGLSKLDGALRFVLKAYADANGGKLPSDKLTEQLKQGIQIKHAELERSGHLDSA